MSNDCNFYAVAIGRTPGIYTTWDTCQAQVSNFSNAKFKRFSSLNEAKAFLNTHCPNNAPQPTSSSSQRAFYAVVKGKVPGVYCDWKSASEQVDGFYSAIYKKFWSRDEAESYIQEYTNLNSRARSDPNPMDASTLVAFCDGSALQNGKKGGKTGYACVFPHNQKWNVARSVNGWKRTNNVAEYHGALEALRRANKENPDQKKVLYVFTDSQLIIKSMTLWLAEWKRNDWKKKSGEPVLNADLIKALDEEQGTRRVIWSHVKAHTNKTDWKSEWNRKADLLAKQAAEGKIHL